LYSAKGSFPPSIVLLLLPGLRLFLLLLRIVGLLLFFGVFTDVPPGGDVIITFFDFVTDASARKARVFVPDSYT